MNCVHCSRGFSPNPRVKNQKYCGAKECRKARRNRMQRMKMAGDPDYRANQKQCQEQWQKNNPGYYKKYRGEHPEYAERNRLLQAGRNAKRGKDKASRLIAKMYSLNRGVYSRKGAVCKLIPQGAGPIAKMYSLTVRVVPVKGG